MFKLDYKNYLPIKTGNYCSVGTIDGFYVFEILTGICNAPEYYEISENEFHSFDTWKEDHNFIVGEIKNRICVASAYKSV